MARIYDLGMTLRVANMEQRETKITYISHEESGRIFARRWGLRVSQLPHGSLFATERTAFGSHSGGHLDAPYHFYPTAEGRPAKLIDEVPLEWLFSDGVVLDFRHKKPTEYITEYDLAAELERIHYQVKPGDIVLLRTGAEDHYDDDPHFHESAAGMNGGALNYMFGLGVTIMGTDSATIDMPIPLMRQKLLAGDKAAYFPIHRAGRLKDWTHAEKVHNLRSLPGPFGYKVMLFPVKIARATGAWIRGAAIEDPWLDGRQVQLVDLSLPIMNFSFEPEPSVITTRHHGESARNTAKQLGIPVSEVVHRSAMDEVETYTHAGTHVDAPYHFGPECAGKPARTIDQVPLDWLYGDGVVLDVRGKRGPGDAITVEDLQAEVGRLNYQLKAGDIVLIRTGASERFADDPQFVELHPGLTRESLLWLLDRGVQAIGCDAESLDRPVSRMVEELKSGRGEAFFPVHYAGRQREFCLIHKLHLAGLPRPTGFKVVAFPIKMEGCGGAWARAVALVPQ